VDNLEVWEVDFEHPVKSTGIAPPGGATARRVLGVVIFSAAGLTGVDQNGDAIARASTAGGQVTFKSEIPSPASRRLAELQKLPHNWDTYGSRPIEAVAVNGAKHILAQASSLGLPPPQISPVGGGGVQLEWTLHRRGLELVVLREGQIEFVGESNGEMHDGNASAWSASIVRDQLNWLAAGVSDVHVGG
jgi:hypothetical protein